MNEQSGEEALINALLNMVDRAHTLLGVYVDPNDATREFNRGWLVLFSKPYTDRWVEKWSDVMNIMGISDDPYAEPVDVDALIAELRRRNGS